MLPNKQAFLDRWSKLKVFCFPGETACPNSGIRDMLHDSETHCLILRKAVWVWDSLPGLETYCLRVERCEIKKARSVSRQLYPRSWLLISSKQACGKIASCLWSHRAKTQTNAMHLVILPEFDVKNLVLTIYHLNYACNLTIYDIECEVLAYKRHSCCGKALLAICDIGQKQALNRLQHEFELGTYCLSLWDRVITLLWAV